MNKWQIGTISLFLLVFTLSIAVTVTYPIPVGYDWHFHMTISRVWARGENGMFCDFVISINRIPYPPVFHLIFVPSIWLNCEVLFSRILQIFLYPLTILASTWMMKKRHGWETAFWTTFLASSTVAIFDYSFQVIPQALEMIFFPLAVYALLQKKQSWFVLSTTLMVYTHGIAAASFFGGLFLYALLEKRWKETATIVAISLPIVVISLLYLPPALARWGQLGQSNVEIAFWKNPLFLAVTYVGTPLIAWPLSIYLALFKRNELSQCDEISILTILSLLIMIPFWPERFLGYAASPFIYLLSPRIAKSKYKKVMAPLLIVVFVIFASHPWVWLITRDYVIIDALVKV